jgi:uncharacterized protein YhaN
MSALHFAELHVRRAPGCKGGWSLRGLGPGINVIFGPNASGKTTTARAITAVLWPSTASQRGEIAASFALDDVSWHAEIHGTSAVFQRDGTPGQPPQIPDAVTIRNRCHVALHDLLQTSDDEIGKAILIEAAGGYDLTAAVATLNFSDKPQLKKSDRSDFAHAQSTLRGIEKSLVALAEDSNRLAKLGVDIEKAEKAGERALLLKQAMESRSHSAAYGVAAARLAGFDRRLEKLAGKESEQLERKQAELTHLLNNKQSEERALEDVRSEIESCRLPEGGVPEAQLVELNSRIEKLRAIDGTLMRLRTDHRAALARADNARQALGAVEDSGVSDLPVLMEIAGFVSQWNDVRSAKDAARKWRDWLGTACEDSDVSALGEAASVLAKWLRSPSPSSTMPRWVRAALIALALILALGSAALALNGSALAWLGLLPAAALLVIAFARAPEVASSATLFPTTRITPPREWTLGAVQERLEEIQRQIAVQKLSAERHSEFARTELSWQQIEQSESELEEQHRELCERLGCKIPPSLFATFVDQAGQWRKSSADAQALAAQIEAQTCASVEELDAIGKILAPYRVIQPNTLAEAHGCVADLIRRANLCRESRHKAIMHQRDCERLQADSERVEREISEILILAQVPDAATLARLLEQLAAFRIAHDEEMQQRGLRDAAVEFFKQNPDLDNRVDGELEGEREMAAAIGATSRSLVEDKIKIEERLRSAKLATAHEEAAARLDGERRSLLDRRSTKIDALAGHLVAEYVAAEMGERAMPPLFEQARKLFGLFTSHAWELIPPDDSGQFRARNTAAGGTGRPLAELSSGTRVQLLLAVRAAFVAEQEKGLQLPLLLDETLANSDDQRAQQIIKAIAELARGGRQIFYFTAQADEVAKWREFFSSHQDVPHHIADLALAQGQAATADFTRVAAPPIIRVPPPGELSYEEYGRLLGAPTFDPRGVIGAVHLWHLCEDTTTLHSLLAMGFERWGQVEAALRHDGEKPICANSARLAAMARLLEELSRCWQHGRSRPLVREALGKAGVSEIFIDRLWKLSCDLDHDAKGILAAIDGGKVPRLQKATIENLRDYCEENGYVSRESPLDAVEIRRKLQVLASELGVDPSHVEALLAKISA